jgi:methyl acetate hydrolase
VRYEALDTVLANAVAAGDAPYLAAAVGNAAGTLWSGAAGQMAPEEPARTDTVFRILSMSKAVGATAAAILADRGELDWDAPVVSVLPAFSQVQVLDGTAGEAPLLRAPHSPVTLRHLATHTSGLAYEVWDESVAHYLAATSTPPTLSGRMEALRVPLVFDPGARWKYGPGVDWLGLAVAAVDGRSIDRFCEEEILGPLGMHDTVFELHADQKDRLAKTWCRSADGGLVPAEVDISPPSRPQFYGMGHALYGTVGDYLRFLRMWLGGGVLEGVRILRAETAADFLGNHTAGLHLPVYASTVPATIGDLAVLPDVDKSHSLGFVRTEVSLPGRRAAGSQCWSGVLNTHFWCDPHSDVAAVLMTQLLPFMDTRFMNTYETFERTVYSVMSAL